MGHLLPLHTPIIERSGSYVPDTIGRQQEYGDAYGIDEERDVPCDIGQDSSGYLEAYASDPHEGRLHPYDPLPLLARIVHPYQGGGGCGYAGDTDTYDEPGSEKEPYGIGEITGHAEHGEQGQREHERPRHTYPVGKGTHGEPEQRDRQCRKRDDHGSKELPRTELLFDAVKGRSYRRGTHEYQHGS